MNFWNAAVPAGEQFTPPSVEVWLLASGSRKIPALPKLIASLSGPEYRLEECEESASVRSINGGVNSAHWRCRFVSTGLKDDPYSEIRLMKRLIGVGVEVMRFEELGRPPRASRDGVGRRPLPRSRALVAAGVGGLR